MRDLFRIGLLALIMIGIPMTSCAVFIFPAVSVLMLLELRRSDFVVARIAQNRIYFAGLQGDRPFGSKDRIWEGAWISADGQRIFGCFLDKPSEEQASQPGAYERQCGMADLQGSLLWSFEKGISATAVSLDMTHVASFDHDGGLRIVQRGVPGAVQVQASHPVPPTQDRFASASWSPDGKTLALAIDGTVSRYDLSNGTLSRIAGFDPTCSPDGRWIVFRTPEQRAVIYNLASHSVLNRPLVDYTVGSVRFSPDGRYILWADDHASFIPALLLTFAAGGPLENRLLVRRLSDGSTGVVYNVLPKGIEAGFQWIDGKRLKEAGVASGTKASPFAL